MKSAKSPEGRPPVGLLRRREPPGNSAVHFDCFCLSFRLVKSRGREATGGVRQDGWHFAFAVNHVATHWAEKICFSFATIPAVSLSSVASASRRVGGEWFVCPLRRDLRQTIPHASMRCRRDPSSVSSSSRSAFGQTSRRGGCVAEELGLSPCSLGVTSSESLWSVPNSPLAS